MKSEEISRQMMEEMEELQLEEQQDSQDESILNQQEFSDMLVPEPEQQFNQHKFIADSLNFNSPEKVTNLDYQELGRPLFNMRFMLDMEDVCKYYLDTICEKYNQPNKVAAYFRAKIKNVADSGLSKDGFIQGINVTKKMDVTRRRHRNLQNLKGGANQEQR